MIRPELNGKLIILGFLGICPNVDIRLSVLDRPIPLTFLLSGRSDEETFDVAMEIAEVNGTSAIASTLVSPVAVDSEGGGFHIAPNFLLTFGYAGEFEIRCTINGIRTFTGLFRVSEGASPLANA